MWFRSRATIRPETALDRVVNHILEEINQPYIDIPYGCTIPITTIGREYTEFSLADRNYIHRCISATMQREISINYGYFDGSLTYLRVW